MVLTRRAFCWTVATGLPFAPRAFASEMPNHDEAIVRFATLVDRHISTQEDLVDLVGRSNSVRWNVYAWERLLRTGSFNRPNYDYPTDSIASPNASPQPQESIDRFLDGDPTMIALPLVISPGGEAAEYGIAVDPFLGSSDHTIRERLLLPSGYVETALRLREGDDQLHGVILAIAPDVERNIKEMTAHVGYIGAERNYLGLELGAKRKEADNYRQRSGDLLERLASGELDEDGFLELRNLVRTPADWRRVIHARQLHYPDVGSVNYESDKERTFGSPLITHNNGHAVCDEWATHFIGCMVGKEGYDTYLVRLERESPNPEARLHAVCVYQRPDQMWSFVSNDFASSMVFEKPEEAVQAAALFSGFNPVTMKIKGPKQIEYGEWLFDEELSVELRPA